MPSEDENTPTPGVRLSTVRLTLVEPYGDRSESAVPLPVTAHTEKSPGEVAHDVSILEGSRAATRSVVQGHLVTSIWRALPCPAWLLAGDGTILCLSDMARREWIDLVVGSHLPTALGCDAMKASISDWLAKGEGAEGLECQLTLRSTDGFKDGKLRLQKVSGYGPETLSVASFVADKTIEVVTDGVPPNPGIRECDRICNSLGQAHIDYLQTMGHELRTPLNAVIGLSELIQAHMKGGFSVDPTTLSRWADQINASGRHLHALIEDLLNKEALEAHELPLHMDHCDLDELVSKAVGVVESKFRKLNIQLHVEDLPQSEAAIADQRRAVQVLVNLLDNAAKYSNAGKMVWLSAQATAQFIRVSVRDEGPGLTGDQQRGLFRMYNRLGAELSGISGSGIGLSTSKRLVERMGGVLVCESAAGSGSNFWFTLPRQLR